MYVVTCIYVCAVPHCLCIVFLMCTYVCEWLCLYVCVVMFVCVCVVVCMCVRVTSEERNEKKVEGNQRYPVEVK